MKLNIKLSLLLLMVVLVSSLVTADLSTDLIVFVNGTGYTDYSGNSVALTTTGTITNNNEQFQLDGGYITYDTADLGSTYTIAGMFKVDDAAINDLFGGYGGTGYDNGRGFVISGKPYFRSPTNIVSDTAPVSTNTWFYYLAIADGTDTAVYIDGNLVASSDVATSSYTTERAIGHTAGGSYELVGDFYNFATWDRVLTTDEIAQLTLSNGNALEITPSESNHTEQAFTDYQLNDVEFITQDTYYEILTATVQNNNENATGYIDVEIQMNSIQDVDVTCKVEVNEGLVMQGTRTNLASTYGSLSLLSEDLEFAQYQEYNLSLQCKKSGNGKVTISESRGIAHYISETIQFDSHNLNYTGVTYSNGVLSSYNFLANYTGNLVIDYASSVVNNQGSAQEILSQVYVDGTPTCAEFKRDIESTKSGSISGSCSIPVTEGVTYQVRTYFTGSNVDVLHQGHFKLLDESEYTKVTTTSITSSETLLATLNYNNTVLNKDELLLKSGLSIHDSNSDVDVWFEINGVDTNPITKTASSNDEVAITTYLGDITAQEYEIKLYAKSDGSTITLNEADFIVYPVNHFERNITTFQIFANDEYTNTSINTFNITIDDVTYLTTTGTITVYESSENVDVSIDVEDYFSRMYLNHNSSNNLRAYPYQTITSFETKQLVTNTSLTSVTYTVDGVTGTEFHFAAGTYEVNATKFGYYDLLYNITISPLFNGSKDILGMYNSLINVTVTDKVVNTPISNFTVNLVRGYFFNTTDSTTTGSLLIPAIAELEYIITTDAPGTYAIVNETITPLTGVYPYTISLYLLHSIQIEFIDSLTGLNMSGTLVTIDIISDDFLYSTSLNTTTGEIQNQVVAPSSYIARYVAENYEERFYYFTLVPNGYNFLTLYMLGNESSQDVEVRIVDENDDIVIGALVKALKYNVETATYELQEIAQTVNNGVATLHLSTEDEFYKFQVEVDGETKITTLPDYIGSTQITLQVNLGTEAGNSYYEFEGIDSSLVFNNETNNFRLTYNAIDGITSNFYLYVYEFVNGDKTLIGSSSSLAPSGTLLVPVTVVNGTYYVAEAFYDTDSYLNSASYGLPKNDSLGNLGLILQIFLSIVFVAATVWEISLLPIALTLSILLGRILHLNILDYTGIIVAVVLSIIVAWFIKRSR